MNKQFIDYLRKLPKNHRPEEACFSAPCIDQDVTCSSCPLQPMRKRSYVEARREYLVACDNMETPQ